MSVYDLDLEKSPANSQPLTPLAFLSRSAAAVVAKPDEKWGETPCAFAELPKTSTGKIQKFKLRELAREVR